MNRLAASLAAVAVLGLAACGGATDPTRASPAAADARPAASAPTAGSALATFAGGYIEPVSVSADGQYAVVRLVDVVAQEGDEPYDADVVIDASGDVLPLTDLAFDPRTLRLAFHGDVLLATAETAATGLQTPERYLARIEPDGGRTVWDLPYDQGTFKLSAGAAVRATETSTGESLTVPDGHPDTDRTRMSYEYEAFELRTGERLDWTPSVRPDEALLGASASSHYVQIALQLTNETTGALDTRTGERVDAALLEAEMDPTRGDRLDAADGRLTYVADGRTEWAIDGHGRLADSGFGRLAVHNDQTDSLVILDSSDGSEVTTLDVAELGGTSASGCDEVRFLGPHAVLAECDSPERLELLALP